MFKIMQTVLTTKGVTPEELQKVSHFTFRRWISNDPRTIQAVNFFNVHAYVPLSAQFIALQAFIQGRIKYIAYPKKIKDVTPTLENIQRYYNTSIQTAKAYLELLTTEELQKIEKELNDFPEIYPKILKGSK
jgi:DNA-binding transcriptional regulator GbsR (MarR family)